MDHLQFDNKFFKIIKNILPFVIFLAGIFSLTGGILADNYQRDLIQKTLNAITGGDAFPYLTLEFKDAEKSVTPFVRNDGANSLYNVQFTIIDHSKILALNPCENFEDYYKNALVMIPYSELPARSLHENGFRIPIDSFETERKFTIYIAARNGFFCETVKFIKVGSLWKRALIVYRKSDTQGLPLLEQADEGYPRDEQGKIVW